MGGLIRANGSVASLPPPRPPECPDLHGKRREFAKVQVLEREIGFLENQESSQIMRLLEMAPLHADVEKPSCRECMICCCSDRMPKCNCFSCFNKATCS